MKKFKYLFLLILMIIITGCTKNENSNVNLEEIMPKLYEGIEKDDIPELNYTKVTKENSEYYLGKVDFEYTEALASEPIMSSIAHSVVLVKLDNANLANTAKKEILEKVNPEKWICVKVDDQNVLTASKKNIVLLVMDNEYASRIKENFLNLDI